MKSNLQIKKTQILLAAGIGLVVSALGGFGLYYLGKTTVLKPLQALPKKIPIETAMDTIDPQEIWRFKLEEALEENKKKLEQLQTQLDEAKLSSFQQNVSVEAESATGDTGSGEIDELRQELSTLKEQFYEAGHEPVNNPLSLQSSVGTEPSGAAGAHSFADSENGMQTVIQKVVLNLREDKKRGLKKTTDNTIPAGAFAKGVLLGGVDASTSIQSSSDPRPVLLRLRDTVTLPRKLKSDLKNCHILASAYGDLSSERVYMRLEKLTCTEPSTHEISEVVVSGYVAGEDGKAGLRGVVVDRTGPLLRNSIVGGFLGGMGRFLTQSQQQITYPLGQSIPLAEINPLTNEQMLKAGVGQGASNALEKYADFYIKRAEQLQPVLQVAAGREVDVVFTASAEIGDTLFKSSLAKRNDQKRRKTVSEMGESQSMKELVTQVSQQESQQSGSYTHGTPENGG